MTKTELKRLISLRRKGYSFAACGHELGYSATTCRRRLQDVDPADLATIPKKKAAKAAPIASGKFEWTDANLGVLQTGIANGDSTASIATKLGCSPSTVRRRIAKGEEATGSPVAIVAPAAKVGFWTPAKERIYADNAGCSVSEMSELLGCSPSTVRRRIAKDNDGGGKSVSKALAPTASKAIGKPTYSVTPDNCPDHIRKKCLRRATRWFESGRKPKHRVSDLTATSVTFAYYRRSHQPTLKITVTKN